MYMAITKRRRGLGELGPDPGGEAPDPVPCLVGVGPLQPGQSFCEGNDKALEAFREYWNAEQQPGATFSFSKWLVPLAAGAFAIFLLKGSR